MANVQQYQDQANGWEFSTDKNVFLSIKDKVLSKSANKI